MRVDDQCLNAVDELIREASAIDVLPKFRALAISDIEEKSPGEVVTAVDRAVEARLSRGLEEILPGSVVVGEEGTSANSALFELISGDQPVWLIDPLDGTSSFVKGDPHFGIMVALILKGEALASWIYHPLTDQMVFALSGEGAFVNGQRVCIPSPTDGDELCGSILTKFLPDDLKTDAEAAIPTFRPVHVTLSAAHEYPDIVRGDKHFALYYRTLPWDHVPGVLMIEEAGGIARRFSGERYDPADGGSGLLVAANEDIWLTARIRILPSLKTLCWRRAK